MLVDPGAPYREDAVRDGRHLMENDGLGDGESDWFDAFMFGFWMDRANAIRAEQQTTGDETV